MQDLQQCLDIQVICRQNNFEQHLLIDCDKLCVPFRYVCCSLASIICIIRIGDRGIRTMVFTVLQNLQQVVALASTE